MITAANLFKTYPGNVTALKNVSFKIEKGEVCAYLGANGAGKTTTVKILCGMIKPDSGGIRINNLDVSEKETQVKRIIGYVPESGALFQPLTPNDFLEFVCKIYEVDETIYKKRIIDFAELFGLRDDLNTPMSAFSKGMRQKVLIISSLIHNPEIICWDEPLSGLDFNTMQLIRDLVKELSEKGKTFFYSSHLLDIVEKICTQVIIIKSGELVHDAKADFSQNSLETLFSKYADSRDYDGQITGEIFKS